MGCQLELLDHIGKVQFCPAPQSKRIAAGRARRGRIAAISGQMAEDRVASRYNAQGYDILARRWRGRAGEIDLICQIGDCLVFVEVKSSRSHACAGERLSRRQMDRICRAACEFCGDRSAGLLSEMRFDAALVDASGRIDVIENAFGG
ncbi:hypothetical protein D3P04_11435 [Paracoccus onubensis]|uniref:UPF0102 protein D3P04_11435 n=2 Tax=Paracoccus onubensis TaxID=1675788 RepID=A0A418SVF3_9RHOB|nr:hypothetical protein D3P04_11435 [Paracoccus onubensis]